MKEFFRILNNAKLFWEYLVVGILFSVISIIGPRASGALVNAVIYKQETLQKNLLILVGIYGLQLLFSIWDQYYLKCFYRNQKRKMRDGVFETCLNQQGLNRERISSIALLEIHWLLAYLINGRNETIPLIERYKSMIEKTISLKTVKIEKLEQIKVEQLTYCADNVKILENISMVFEGGKKYLLTGESGSGKTTLLNLFIIR